jgi:hypothetical protein
MRTDIYVAEFWAGGGGRGHCDGAFGESDGGFNGLAYETGVSR